MLALFGFHRRRSERVVGLEEAEQHAAASVRWGVVEYHGHRMVNAEDEAGQVVLVARLPAEVGVAIVQHEQAPRGRGGGRGDGGGK